MTIAISGWNTTIVRELLNLTPRHEKRVRIKARVESDDYTSNVPDDFPRCDRYLFAQGMLPGEDLLTNTSPNRVYEINLISVMQRTQAAFALNPKACVVVVGSVSGIAGSYDTYYATAKAGLHHFVRTWQQLPETGTLNCVAPTIVRDSGMTESRDDYEQVIAERQTLSARQVAEMCHYLLYNDHGLNRAVIEMSGRRLHMNEG